MSQTLGLYQTRLYVIEKSQGLRKYLYLENGALNETPTNNQVVRYYYWNR